MSVLPPDSPFIVDEWNVNPGEAVVIKTFVNPLSRFGLMWGLLRVSKKIKIYFPSLNKYNVYCVFDVLVEGERKVRKGNFKITHRFKKWVSLPYGFFTSDFFGVFCLRNAISEKDLSNLNFIYIENYKNFLFNYTEEKMEEIGKKELEVITFKK